MFVLPQYKNAEVFFFFLSLYENRKSMSTVSWKKPGSSPSPLVSKHPPNRLVCDSAVQSLEQREKTKDECGQISIMLHLANFSF